MQNFIKISQTVVGTWRFIGFQNGGHSPSWIFETEILTYHAACVIVSSIAMIDFGYNGLWL